MKYRPILFSGAMVRALLDGRKTQTRRIVKCDYHDIEERDDGSLWPWREDLENGGDIWYPCKYGQPGDRLWVRETCRAEELESGLDGVRYLADDAFEPIENTPEAADKWGDLRWYGKRASPASRVKAVPSIHMPRWASRITLEITGVRVERLQDISEEDALAEGIHYDKAMKGYQVEDGMNGMFYHGSDPRISYRDLWEHINGDESWDLNPWVWVVEFRRVPQQK